MTRSISPESSRSTRRWTGDFVSSGSLVQNGLPPRRIPENSARSSSGSGSRSNRTRRSSPGPNSP